MTRNELFEKMGLIVPDVCKVRVMVDTDADNETDDQFAIMHHLLSPSLHVVGMIATHFEEKVSDGNTMKRSYLEIEKLLKLANIDDVPVYKGSQKPLKYGLEESDGALAIIKEAKKPGKLYIACQGALTNVATALMLDPSIGENIVLLWNGGEPYGVKRVEFNVAQDIRAVQMVMKSSCAIWQTPQDVYSSLEVSIAELKAKVFPCGEVGKYLFNHLMEVYPSEYNPYFKLRTGENWTLGDNTTIAMLLSTNLRGNSHEIPCPNITDDGHYVVNEYGRKITVFDSIDVRFTLEDFFSKMKLAYGN